VGIAQVPGEGDVFRPPGELLAVGDPFSTAGDLVVGMDHDAALFRRRAVHGSR
jgi:hypothetical protein